MLLHFKDWNKFYHVDKFPSLTPGAGLSYSTGMTKSVHISANASLRGLLSLALLLRV